MRSVKKLDIASIFTEEEKAALSLLVERGFKAFTAAKLEDVRELDGLRRRTFRNQGRYDLVLALRTADPDPDLEDRNEAQTQAMNERCAGAVETAMAEIRAEYEGKIEKLKTEHEKALADLVEKNRAAKPKTKKGGNTKKGI